MDYKPNRLLKSKSSHDYNDLVNIRTKETPRHIIYYFKGQNKFKQLLNNREKLKETIYESEKDDSCSRRIFNQLKETTTNEIDLIINPFDIKCYSRQQKNLPLNKINRKRNLSCEMNSIALKNVNKIPAIYDRYKLNLIKDSPSKMFSGDRYAKKRLNIEDVLINQQANQIKQLPKMMIKEYQLKKSLLLMSKERDRLNKIYPGLSKSVFGIEN